MLLAALVCRPPGVDGPAPVAELVHGTLPNAEDRLRIVHLIPCGNESTAWFLRHGFVTITAARRGFNPTFGAWQEEMNDCNDPRSYVPAGLASARDVAAVMNYARELPFVKPDGAVVAGESTGGFATIAYDSVPHPGVVALIDMAGGHGGHYEGTDDRVCQPEALVAAVGRFGRTATTPMLWIYTANDSFFPPPLVRRMADAFTAAGGRIDLHQLGPFGEDGHDLFFATHGAEVFGPLFDRYLAARRGD